MKVLKQNIYAVPILNKKNRIHFNNSKIELENVKCKDIVISAEDDRYLVCDGSVHESQSLRLRRGVKIYKIKTIKLNISKVGLSQCKDLGT